MKKPAGRAWRGGVGPLFEGDKLAGDRALRGQNLHLASHPP